MAVHCGDAAVGPQDRREHADCYRLARAVGTEEPEDLTFPDLKTHVIHCGEFSELLHQARHFNHVAVHAFDLRHRARILRIRSRISTMSPRSSFACSGVTFRRFVASNRPVVREPRNITARSGPRVCCTAAKWVLGCFWTPRKYAFPAA